ncbi:MAG: hypothetical protein NVV82_14465 [Sporocytophaga sp.]|nr:hypothetical protein [Sporocytophaga sp.]
MSTNENSTKSDLKKLFFIAFLSISIALAYFIYTGVEKNSTIMSQRNRILQDSLLIVKKSSEIEKLKADLLALQLENEVMKDSVKQASNRFALALGELRSKETELEYIFEEIQKQKATHKLKEKEYARNEANVKYLIKELVKFEEVITKKAEEAEAGVEFEANAASGFDSENTDEVSDAYSKKAPVKATLKVREISIVAIVNGKEIKADAISLKPKDKLKFRIALAAFPESSKGRVEVTVRLVEPGGKTLYNPFEGGGMIKVGETEIPYTVNKDFEYSGSKNINFVFEKGSEYKPGKHLMQVYLDGKLSGATSFQVI